jgi:hypothetical protein
VPRQRQRLGAKDESIRGNHEQVGIQCRKRFPGYGIAQRRGLVDLDPEFFGGGLYDRRVELATPAGGAIRLSYDECDVVAWISR